MCVMVNRHSVNLVLCVIALSNFLFRRLKCAQLLFLFLPFYIFSSFSLILSQVNSIYTLWGWCAAACATLVQVEMVALTFSETY